METFVERLDRERAERIEKYLLEGAIVNKTKKLSLYDDFEYDDYYLELNGKIVQHLTCDEYMKIIGR